MKKKILFLATILLTLSGCGNDSEPEATFDDIVGLWYEEDTNEEVRFDENGRFYDIYCNMQSDGRFTQGTYEMDGYHLTETYDFKGSTAFSDWTVKSVDENTFTIESQELGRHTYRRVVETITLAVGGSQSSQYLTSGSVSLSPELVEVANGQVTSTGRKGKAYIRTVVDNVPAYVKVVVGVNERFFDYWFDYSIILGMTETQMRAAIGEPSLVDEGLPVYAGMRTTSDYIDYMMVVPSNQGLVTDVFVQFKEGVGISTIKAFLETKFFNATEFTSSGENIVGHTSCEQLSDSKFYIYYYPESNFVWYTLK